MIDYTDVIIFAIKMAITLGLTLIAMTLVVIAVIRGEKVLTQRRQHRDTLQEIRRLKADQAYACLFYMNQYFRMEIKHGQYTEAEREALDKAWKHLIELELTHGVHLEEEYR
jgi:hypothetical protein